MKITAESLLALSPEYRSIPFLKTPSDLTLRQLDILRYMISSQVIVENALCKMENLENNTEASDGCEDFLEKTMNEEENTKDGCLDFRDEYRNALLSLTNYLMYSSVYLRVIHMDSVSEDKHKIYAQLINDLGRKSYNLHKIILNEETNNKNFKNFLSELMTIRDLYFLDEEKGEPLEYCNSIYNYFEEFVDDLHAWAETANWKGNFVVGKDTQLKDLFKIILNTLIEISNLLETFDSTDLTYRIILSPEEEESISERLQEFQKDGIVSLEELTLYGRDFKMLPELRENNRELEYMMRLLDCHTDTRKCLLSCSSVFGEERKGLLDRTRMAFSENLRSATNIMLIWLLGDEGYKKMIYQPLSEKTEDYVKQFDSKVMQLHSRIKETEGDEAYMEFVKDPYSMEKLIRKYDTEGIIEKLDILASETYSNVICDAAKKFVERGGIVPDELCAFLSRFYGVHLRDVIFRDGLTESSEDLFGYNTENFYICLYRMRILLYYLERFTELLGRDGSYCTLPRR